VNTRLFSPPSREGQGWVLAAFTVADNFSLSPPPCGEVGKFAPANFRVGVCLTHLPTPTPNPPHKGEGASSEQSDG
jgi:hypothetical protein